MLFSPMGDGESIKMKGIEFVKAFLIVVESTLELRECAIGIEIHFSKSSVPLSKITTRRQ